MSAPPLDLGPIKARLAKGWISFGETAAKRETQALVDEIEAWRAAGRSLLSSLSLHDLVRAKALRELDSILALLPPAPAERP